MKVQESEWAVANELRVVGGELGREVVEIVAPDVQVGLEGERSQRLL